MIEAGAKVAQPFLKRFFGPYESLLAAGYAVGLAAVVRSWRKRPTES